MDSRVFYSQKNKYKVRVPPEYENEDSELSDSDDDPDYTHHKRSNCCLIPIPLMMTCLRHLPTHVNLT